MLLNENARQIVLDLNYSAKVAERMKVCGSVEAIVLETY